MQMPHNQHHSSLRWLISLQLLFFSPSPYTKATKLALMFALLSPSLSGTWTLTMGFWHKAGQDWQNKGGPRRGKGLSFPLWINKPRNVLGITGLPGGFQEGSAQKGGSVRMPAWPNEALWGLCATTAHAEAGSIPQPTAFYELSSSLMENRAR